MKKLIPAGIGAVLLVSVAGGITLHSLTSGDTKAPKPKPPGARASTPNAPRHFFSASTLPGPLTKRGAEVRVLSRPGINAVPATIKPQITGITVGGLIRQNSHASCYLNLSGTARHCELVIRAGAKPWAAVQFRVDTGGVHYLSAIYWAR